MDAREFDFEPDDPLPQTCQHCKWAERHHVETGGSVLLCKNATNLADGGPLFPWLPDFKPSAFSVSATHTCKHWEERE